MDTLLLLLSLTIQYFYYTLVCWVKRN